MHGAIGVLYINLFYICTTHSATRNPTVKLIFIGHEEANLVSLLSRTKLRSRGM